LDAVEEALVDVDLELVWDVVIREPEPLRTAVEDLLSR